MADWRRVGGLVDLEAHASERARRCARAAEGAGVHAGIPRGSAPLVGAVRTKRTVGPRHVDAVVIGHDPWVALLIRHPSSCCELIETD